MANGKLYTASMPIFGGLEQHSFIIFDPNTDGDSNPLTFTENGDSEPMILRAGVNPSGETGANVIVEAGVSFSDSKDKDFYISIPSSEKNIREVTLLAGQTAEGLFTTMVAQTKAMGTLTATSGNYETNANYFLDYNFVCHSYTSGLLAMNGIDFAGNLPKNLVTGQALTLDDYRFSDTAFVSGSGTIVFDTFSRITKIIDTGTGDTTILVDATNPGPSGITLLSDSSVSSHDKLVLKGIDPSDLLLWTYNNSDLEITDRQGHVIAKLIGQLNSNRFDSLEIRKPDGSTVYLDLPQSNSDIPPWTPLIPREDVSPPPSDALLVPAELNDMAPAAGSPLILDLDGDGVETTALRNGTALSNVHFDLDGDGFAERSGWVGKDDALLVRDLDGNGSIDGLSEVFGASDPSSNGFITLKALDSNGDNKITAADAGFASLRLWIDADQDGRTDAGELVTLASRGVTGINLNATALTGVTNAENSVSHRATFTKSDGSTGTIEDVWFRMDQMDTVALNPPALDVRTLFLPTLRGFGTLMDLHSAMSGNTALMDKVTALVTGFSFAKFGNPTALNAEIEDILFTWAGVEGVSPTARGNTGFDSRKLEFLEAFFGKEYRDVLNNNSPDLTRLGSASVLNNSWTLLFTELKAALLAQAGLSSLYEQPPVYNPALGAFTGEPILSQSAIQSLGAAAAASSNPSTFWRTLVETLLRIEDVSHISAQEVLWLDQAIKVSIPSWSWAVVVNSMPAAISVNLAGTEFSDYLVGADAADSLSGYGGNDILKGGAGNDHLYGGSGDDSYLFGIGDGSDQIGETVGGGIDTLALSDGITPDRVSLSRPYLTALEIRIDGQTGVSVYDQFFSTPLLERVTFADGTVWDLTTVRNVEGTANAEVLNGLDHVLLKDDVIYGYGGNDTLNGLAGNDRLYGGDGNDVLDGGLGDDRLEGGAGNDRYNYTSGAGKGTDTIYDIGGSADWMSMGSAYPASAVTLERVGPYDMAIVSGGERKFLIVGQFTNPSSIETLRLGDGSSINLMTYTHTVNGTAANDIIDGTSYGAGGDVLNGFAGNDTITAGLGDDIVTGGDGNDSIRGDGGNDTLSGNAGNDGIFAGDGNDTVIWDSGLDRLYDAGGTDVVSIADASATAANLTLRRSGQIDLDILLNGTHAFTLQNQFLLNQHFESIRFANGTTFDLMSVRYTAEGTAANDTLYGIGYGGNPDDIINGNAGNDGLYGYGGNDTLSGGDGDDTIDGADGNDTLRGNAGNDTIYGGNGDDTVIYDSGLDRLSDSGGVDGISIADGSVTAANVSFRRVGQYDLDVLLNGAHAFTIQSQFAQGFETLRFANGTTLDLLSIQHTMNGTAANDMLYGVSYGGSINDTLNGGGGNDTLWGYAGNDVLNGGSGTDALNGGDGDDIFQIDLNSGLDTISDTGGTDKIVFGSGFAKADMTLARAGDNLNILFGGILAATVSSHFSSTLASQLDRIQFADGTSTNILNTTLTLTGTTGGDSLKGYVGKDRLEGDAGSDTLWGFGGNDTLIGGAGRDTLYGGVGDDTYVFAAGFGDASGEDYVGEYANDGIDTVSFTSAFSPDQVRMWTDGFGRIVLGLTSNPADKIILTTSVNASTQEVSSLVERVSFSNGTVWDLTQGLPMTDTDEAHTLKGTALADTIDGRGGNDTLRGYGDNDILIGGTGQDNLYGGVGDDTYIFAAGFGDASAEDYIGENANEGIDTISFTGAFSPDQVRMWTDGYGRIILGLTSNPADKIMLSTSVNTTTQEVSSLVERVSFSNGTVWDLTQGLPMTDTDEAHTLKGTALADTIDGRGGNDTLRGYGDNDTLIGGTGLDNLYGGNGDDSLNGGVDADYLNGGAGADRFIFDALSAFTGVDMIGDFKTSEGDRLDIANLLVGYDPLQDAITDFVTFTASGSNMTLSVDRDGTASSTYAAHQIALLQNVSGLNAETLETAGLLIAA